MTWKEFKERVEREGVKDEDEINFIDVSFPLYSDEKVSARREGLDPRWRIEAR
jgi:hypothetical protein